jgi:hypothetical protein
VQAAILPHQSQRTKPQVTAAASSSGAVQGSVLVVMPRVVGQDLPKVLFAVDQRVHVTTQWSIERHRPSGRPAGVRPRRRAGLACQRS